MTQPPLEPPDESPDAAPDGDAAIAKPGAAPPARRTAGAAASRARRIGGAVPSPRASADPDTDPSTDSSTADRVADTDDAANGTPTVTTSFTKRTKKTAGRPSKTEAASATKTVAAPGDKSTAPGDKSTAPGDKSTEKRARRPLPRWVPLVPTVVFAAVAIVFLALFAVARVHHDSGPATTSGKQREQVIAAAKTCVAATNTYRYTDIDKYEKAGIACTTGVYGRQYRTAMDTLIKKNAPTQKFTQIAQVNVAGLESVTKDAKQWGILVYGQLNITNVNTGKQGRVDPFGVVATMQQAKGKWVVAKISLVNQVTGS